MMDLTVGADISKDHIDLYSLPDGQAFKVSNDRKGFAAILKWIDAGNMGRIVYEPTGPYHKAFERFMAANGLALSKVNPHLQDGLLKPQADWPRPTGSMPDCWPVTARFLSRACCKPKRKSTMT